MERPDEEDSGRRSEGAGEPDRDRDRSVRLFSRRVCRSCSNCCVNPAASKGPRGGGGGAREGGLEPAMMWIFKGKSFRSCRLFCDSSRY